MTDEGRERIVDRQVHGRMSTRVDVHANWWAYGKAIRWWVTKQVEGTVNAQCQTRKYGK